MGQGAGQRVPVWFKRMVASELLCTKDGQDSQGASAEVIGEATPA